MSYQIIGNDGRTYGPATLDQVRVWISQGRAESRTPVLVAGTSTWSTLGLLPEFAPLFTAPPPLTPPTPPIPPTSPPIPASPPGTLTPNSFATAGLVFGIISLLCCCCCGGFPFNILGLVFSLIALVQISDHPERYSGRSQAIVGIALSAVSFMIFLASLVGNHSNVFYHMRGF